MPNIVLSDEQLDMAKEIVEDYLNSCYDNETHYPMNEEEKAEHEMTVKLVESISTALDV